MDPAGTINYIPILLIFIVAVVFAVTSVAISRMAGRQRPTREKLAPYECGVEPIGNARERQSVKFYLVAMLFLLFDLEVVFLIPWAVVFRDVLTNPEYQQLGSVFYWGMLVFLFLLVVGLAYEWRKGGMEWNQ